MTYLPPLNGGRINVTIGSNTAGAGALVSSGTMMLAGGNNITLSQNANTITIVGAAAGAGFSAGISNIGGTSGTSGMATNQLVFAGGNNVILSQATGAGGNTLTISAASQTNQTVGLYALGNTTQNASTTLDARTLSFNGLGGATVGYSNGSIQISAPQTVAQTNQTLAFTAAGNTTLTTAATFDARSFMMNGQGAASVGYSSSSVVVSVPVQTAQTLGLYAVGNVTQSSNTVLDARTLSFQGAGGASVGYSNGSVIISAPTGGGGVALAAAGATYNSGTVSINASGALTISSATTGQSLNFSVPQTSSLVGSNGITISSAGGTISIIAPAMFNFAISSNTAGTAGTVTNALILAGGNNITLSQSTNTNGATVTVNGVSPTTLSRFEYPEGLFTTLQTIVTGSLSINHMYIPFYVTGSAAKIGGSISVQATNIAASTASANMSLLMGIYTLNGSTLSLVTASSGSANNAFSWQAASSATGASLTGVNGMRQLTVPMNVNLTPGEYWMAAVILSASTVATAALTLYGNAQVATGSSNAVLMPIGSGTANARDAMLLQGMYSSTTNALPANIPGASINNLVASNVMRANFYNAIYNATY